MPTQIEFAKHMGIARSRVSELLSLGILPKDGSLDDWRIAAYKHATASKAGWATATGNLEAEKTRLTKAQADLAELELKQKHGSFIAIEDYDRELGDLIMSARARLLALPGKATPLVMAADNMVHGQRILQDLVYEALEELAHHADEPQEIAMKIPPEEARAVVRAIIADTKYEAAAAKAEREESEEVSRSRATCPQPGSPQGKRKAR